MLNNLETAAISLKLISNISLLLFCSIMYLGIQGYNYPNMVMRWGGLITFIIFILTVVPNYITNFVSDWKSSSETDIDIETDKKGEKSKLKIVLEYLMPIVALIILYAWAKIGTNVPLYGENKTYNIFSIVGFGQEYLGETVQNGGGISSYILKLYTYILTTISTMTYMYGLSWITKGDGLIASIISISTLIYTTIGKAILGYVPKNGKLIEKNSWFFEFMQHRVKEDMWVSKLAALLRRFTLLGLDTDVLDGIIESPEYCNIFPRKSLEEYEKNRNDYLKNIATTSWITKWKWETLPYLYHWTILSMIGYILGGIFIIIVYGVK